MSLLIKALEQAAKDRKAGRAAAGANPATAEPATANAAAAASGPVEPTLEPPPQRREPARAEPEPARADTGRSEEPAPAPKAPSPLSMDAGAAPRRAPSTLATLAASDAQQRARAATVMQAGGRSQHVIAWLRANPVMMAGAAAVVFGLGFAIYVYLQIAQPGAFTRQAATSPQPTAPAAPPLPPGAPAAVPDYTPAPVAALPATDPVLAPAGTQPVGPPASSGTIAPAAAPPAPSGALSSSSVLAPAPPAPETRGSLERMPEPRRERSSARAAERAETPRVAAAPPSAGAVSAAAAARERIAVTQTTVQPRVNPTLSQAYTLLQAGSIEESRALYAKLSQAEPLNVDALLGLAYIAAQENRSDDAMKLYLRILQINPRHAVAQGALIGLMGRADPTASETRLKQLIAREPSPFLHFILGNLYADQSQWSQAQQAYFQAHHLEPENPDYAYNLAVGLDHLRQAKLALNFYRRAEQLASAQGRSNFNVSHARERIRALSSPLE
jgi:cytochrome c-type biogenesis protein CcmH/NrfG